jgi:predicted DNA-binding transcriptional regulator YafY
VVVEAGVGYSLVRGYHLPPVMLTADEATALFVGAEMVRQFTDASLSAPMSAVLDKLRAVLPPDRQEHVERLARRTLVVGRLGGSTVDPAAQPWLLAVQRGVAQRRVLRMTYRGRERAETARDVEPLGVVCYGGAWNLVAWCRLRKDVRHFRVDRIRTLTQLDEPVTARPDFSLAKHLEESVAREATLPVRVWFARDAQERARRESHATLVEERPNGDGMEFALYAWSLEWMANWLLSFGEQAEALAPAKLRELVRDKAEKTAGRYAKETS